MCKPRSEPGNQTGKKEKDDAPIGRILRFAGKSVPRDCVSNFKRAPNSYPADFPEPPKINWIAGFAAEFIQQCAKTRAARTGEDSRIGELPEHLKRFGLKAIEPDEPYMNMDTLLALALIELRLLDGPVSPKSNSLITYEDFLKFEPSFDDDYFTWDRCIINLLNEKLPEFKNHQSQTTFRALAEGSEENLKSLLLYEIFDKLCRCVRTIGFANDAPKSLSAEQEGINFFEGEFEPGITFKAHFSHDWSERFRLQLDLAPRGGKGKSYILYYDNESGAPEITKCIRFGNEALALSSLASEFAEYWLM